MRIGIIAPNYYPEVSGNAVTVRRIVHHLGLLGCEVRVFPVDHSAERLLKELKEFAPQILHAFHGYHGGRVACPLARELEIPFLVTLTGTDVYDFLTNQHSLETHCTLRASARLVAFHACIKRRLAEHLPSLEERTVVIPQGVELPSPPAEEQPVGDTFTFLFPAGLRPVKNVLFPLEPLAELHAGDPQLRLKVVGPVVDALYAKKVMDSIERYSFASYLGAVSHEAMGEHYRQADVVLNCSLSEGGMANTVLEALSYRKPLLVSDIEGNRSVLKEGVTGLLYRDAREFGEKARLLLEDRHLRERLGKNGLALVREKHSPEKEARCYLDLYHSILQG